MEDARGRKVGSSQKKNRAYFRAIFLAINNPEIATDLQFSQLHQRPSLRPSHAKAPLAFAHCCCCCCSSLYLDGSDLHRCRKHKLNYCSDVSLQLQIGWATLVQKSTVTLYSFKYFPKLGRFGSQPFPNRKSIKRKIALAK